FNFKKELVLETSYSKQTQNIMNDSVKKAIEYGKDVHKLLEDVDFNDLEASLSILPIKIRQSLKKLLDSKLFDFDKNPFIYQEYEFYDTIDNNTVHGVIDLLIVYDDVIYILDYKLKNIDDLAYAKQMNGYKKYIGTKTKKPMQLYLYSVLDEILTEV
ncbi:MAG: PD-(D/E)XK nuclease family protein, partial [Tenericutes bacterium]|nr:PD-(D/E)XK nuclease family protein [Mycoplasmatota bacterium]